MIADDLRMLAAKDLLGFVGAEVMPPEAMRALLDGIDSPSVRQLARMDEADSEDVRATFRAALRELAIELPSRREAAILLATEVARRITEGAISPYEGATEIWGIAQSSREHLPELDTFVYGASEWEERPKDRNRFAAGIVAAARDLVVSGSS
jgi:hypothetical protein